MMRRKTVPTMAALALVAVLLLAGCQVLGVRRIDRLRSDEHAHEDEWLGLGIHSYAITTVGAFMIQGIINDSLRVIVRADTIQSVYDIRTKTYVDRSFGLTVPQLFAYAVSAIEMGADGSGDTHAVVRYDPAYHFPSDVSPGVPDAGGRSAGDFLPNIP